MRRMNEPNLRRGCTEMLVSWMITREAEGVISDATHARTDITIQD